MVEVLEEKEYVKQTAIPKESVKTIQVTLANGGSRSVQFFITSARMETVLQELVIEGDDRVWLLHGEFAEHHFQSRTQALAEMIDRIGPEKEPLVVANSYLLLATSVSVFCAPKRSVNTQQETADLDET